MTMQPPFYKFFATLTIIFCLSCSPFQNADTEKERSEQVSLPNIIFIMADDLGYGDVGVYGQQQIQTPNLDRLAQEGMRFTQFYAGSTVCAPSRSVLMTGQHTGRTRVRGNAAGNDTAIQSLQAEDTTVAEVLKEAGYTTALVGKWGLGEIDEPGMPLHQGFDQFYGYLNQRHAHNYYPEFLWNNRDSVHLNNEVKRTSKSAGFAGGYATKKVDYSHDLFIQEALSFIENNKEQPFFLYLALTIPHANNEAGNQGMEVPGGETPDLGDYANKDWPETAKALAAMITRMDGDVGHITNALKKYGIDENTVIFFTSDNGPHQEGGNDPFHFDSNGPLQGIKRALYEGGIRVPFIAHWPGHIPAGTTSDHISYLGDMMATFADIVGVKPPDSIQSISILPTLTGNQEQQKKHDYLYWEFYEQESRQAVRMGEWKGLRQPMLTGEIQLFNLENDLAEQNNVANQNPEIVEKMKEIMEEAHEPSPLWVVRR